MIYRFPDDDKTFVASSHIELATLLWQSAFDPQSTLEEWMLAFSNRAYLWNDAVLRTDSADHLISDMLAAGLIVEVEP